MDCAGAMWDFVASMQSDAGAMGTFQATSGLRERYAVYFDHCTGAMWAITTSMQATTVSMGTIICAMGGASNAMAHLTTCAF